MARSSVHAKYPTFSDTMGLLLSEEARTYEETCLFLRGGSGRLRGGRLGQGIDHLARLGIAQLLAGFLLNGLGVGFERLDVVLELLVLQLQVLDLLLKALMLSAFLLIDHHPIGAKDHMEGDHAGQRKHHGGGDAPPPFVEADRDLPEELVHYAFSTQSFAAALNLSRSLSDVASEYTLTTGSVPESR